MCLNSVVILHVGYWQLSCFVLSRSLADVDGDGQLKAEEFILAMHLTDMAKAGQPLPLTLPPELVPPSFRCITQGDTSLTLRSVSWRTNDLDF